MQYYIFEPACDTPETGHQYPQVQKMKPGYDFKAVNSVHALSRAYQDFPDFEPDLDHFIVHAQAKLTELLSVAPVDGGVLISERLKNIFEQSTIVPHKFYSAKLKYRKAFYENYYWMHIICNLSELVDYRKSTFFIYYNYAHNLGFIDVNSKEEYLKKKRKVQIDNPDKVITVWANKIYMIDHFDKNLDLFEIGAFNADYFISESLKNAIIKEKITGCSIAPADNLKVSA
jgi:hypothetical protein